MYETLIRVILVMGDDGYRHGCSVCGRCFGSHCDCPDSDAALIKRDA